MPLTIINAGSSGSVPAVIVTTVTTALQWQVFNSFGTEVGNSTTDHGWNVVIGAGLSPTAMTVTVPVGAITGDYTAYYYGSTYRGLFHVDGVDECIPQNEIQRINFYNFIGSDFEIGDGTTSTIIPIEANAATVKTDLETVYGSDTVNITDNTTVSPAGPQYQTGVAAFWFDKQEHTSVLTSDYGAMYELTDGVITSGVHRHFNLLQNSGPDSYDWGTIVDLGSAKNVSGIRFSGNRIAASSASVEVDVYGSNIDPSTFLTSGFPGDAYGTLLTSYTILSTDTPFDINSTSGLTGSYRYICFRIASASFTSGDSVEIYESSVYVDIATDAQYGYYEVEFVGTEGMQAVPSMQINYSRPSSLFDDLHNAYVTETQLGNNCPDSAPETSGPVEFDDPLGTNHIVIAPDLSIDADYMVLRQRKFSSGVWTSWHTVLPTEGTPIPGTPQYTYITGDPDTQEPGAFRFIGSTAFKMTGLDLDTIYAYYFIAVNRLNPTVSLDGPVAEIRTNTTDDFTWLSIPDPPIFVSSTQTSILVAMPTKPPEADSLSLQVSVSGVWYDYATLLASGATVNVVTDGTVTMVAGTIYTFRTVAVSGSGLTLLKTFSTSVNFSTKPLGPGTPVAPVLTVISKNQIDITAPLTVAHATSMKLRYSDDGRTTWHLITTELIGTVTAYHHTALTPNHNYCYEWEASNDTATVDGPYACATTFDDVPAKPDVVVFDLSYATHLSIYKLGSMPTRTTDLQLLRKKTGDTDWTVAFDNVVLSGPSVLNDTGLLPDTTYYYVWNAVNGSGSVMGDVAANHMDVTEAIQIPNKPLPPTVSGDLTGTSITINSPIWDLTYPYTVDSMQLYQDGVLIHTWMASGGTFNVSVDKAEITAFTVKACNDAGCSVASDPLNISLVSTTVAVGWLAPAASSTVTYRVHLTYSVVDSDDDITETYITANNIQLGTSILLPGGTMQNGSWSYYWDTRDFYSGTVQLVAWAKGSDGLWNSANLSVTVSNTLRDSVYYRDFCYTLDRVGYLITQPHFGIESYELAANVARRFWMQIAFRVGSTSIVFDETTMAEAEAETEWAALQQASWNKGASWKPDTLDGNPILSPSTDVNDAIITQLYANPSLTTPSALVCARLRLTPAEVLYAFETNCDKIKKIRQINNDTTSKTPIFLIVCANPSKVYVYNGSTFTLLIDLSVSRYNIPTPTDVTYDNSGTGKFNKVYIVDGTNIKYINIVESDRLTSDVGLVEKPLAEAKNPVLVEMIGKIPMWFFSDGTNTSAWAIQDEIEKVWDLTGAITVISTIDGTKLAFAVGNMLYSSMDGITAPAIVPFSTDVNNFPHNITAIDNNLVGLSNGDVYSYDTTNSVWVKVATSTGAVAINAVTSWSGSTPTVNRGVASINSHQLIEQMANSLWSNGRIIEAPEEVEDVPINKITALGHYSNTVSSLSPQGINSITSYDDRLLMATDGVDSSPDALFMVMERSTLDESSGAYLVSYLSDPDIYPVAIEPTPTT